MKLRDIEIKVKNIEKRDSNIELLRIITMIMIILHHIALYTDLANDNVVLYIILIVLGKLGVDIFILITGYFQVNKKFSFKKVISLYAQIWFYSVSIEIIAMITNPGYKFNIRSIFPILTCRYWFMNAYLLMYILSPFLNKIMNTAKKETMNKAIKVILAVLTVSTFSFMNKVIGVIFLFLAAYMLGAYIKLYDIRILKDKPQKDIIIYALSAWIILLFMKVIYQKCYPRIICDDSERSIINVILAVLIFYVFKNMKMKKNCIINYLGKCSLAVYLFHEQPIVKEILWNIFKDIGRVNTFLYIIFIVTAIWMVTITMEEIRKSIHTLIFNKKVDVKLEIVYKKVDKFFELE